MKLATYGSAEKLANRAEKLSLDDLRTLLVNEVSILSGEMILGEREDVSVGWGEYLDCVFKKLNIAQTRESLIDVAIYAYDLTGADRAETYSRIDRLINDDTSQLEQLDDLCSVATRELQWWMHAIQVLYECHVWYKPLLCETKQPAFRIYPAFAEDERSILSILRSKYPSLKFVRNLSSHNSVGEINIDFALSVDYLGDY